MADQRSGTDQDLEEFIEAADALFYAMRRSRAAISGQQTQGLSLSQLAMLSPLVDDDGELPVGSLAAAADVSVPTATRMLQQLQNKGIITRRRSLTDERRVLIGLTPERSTPQAARHGPTARAPPAGPGGWTRGRPGTPRGVKG